MLINNNRYPCTLFTATHHTNESIQSTRLAQNSHPVFGFKPAFYTGFITPAIQFMQIIQLKYSSDKGSKHSPLSSVSALETVCVHQSISASRQLAYIALEQSWNSPPGRILSIYHKCFLYF